MGTLSLLNNRLVLFAVAWRFFSEISAYKKYAAIVMKPLSSQVNVPVSEGPVDTRSNEGSTTFGSFITIMDKQ